MHKFNELTDLQSAVAQTNPSDPGTAGLSAVSYNLSSSFADPSFFADYVSQRCNGVSADVDCFRFRFCVRRDAADCAAGVGNERYVIQTILINRTPRTVMGE